jgi:death-on-curing protein
MTKGINLDDLIESLTEIGFVVRDVGLLASALERPLTTVFGEEAYPSFEEKAAVLVQSIATFHPMLDGNKRSAWIALNVFVEHNGYTLDVATEDALAFMLGVATTTLETSDIVDWLRFRLKPLD